MQQPPPPQQPYSPPPHQQPYPPPPPSTGQLNSPYAPPPPQQQQYQQYPQPYPQDQPPFPAEYYTTAPPTYDPSAAEKGFLGNSGGVQTPYGPPGGVAVAPIPAQTVEGGISPETRRTVILFGKSFVKKTFIIFLIIIVCVLILIIGLAAGLSSQKKDNRVGRLRGGRGGGGGSGSIGDGDGGGGGGGDGENGGYEYEYDYDGSYTEEDLGYDMEMDDYLNDLSNEALENASEYIG